ncbi:MAG: Hsp20/alpha crystallin family protein [Bacteriovoracia bacterium]
MRRTSVFFPNFTLGLEPFERESVRTPPSLVQENAEGYYLQVDVPGIAREDISISLEQDHLILEGKRKGQLSQKIRKAFLLPNDVDAEKIEAEVANGVLELLLPKKAQAKPKTISVSEGKGGIFHKLLKKEEKESA